VATIVDKGLECMARLINGVLGGSPAVNYFTYLANGVGMASESTSDTELNSENVGDGMGRAAATCTYLAGNIAQLHYQWDPVASGYTITEIGVFDGPTVGTANSNMLMRHVFTTPIVIVKQDFLDLTVKITMNR
jgi:hypothetical protein